MYISNLYFEKTINILCYIMIFLKTDKLLNIKGYENSILMIQKISHLSL